MTTPGSSIWQPFDPAEGPLPSSLSTPPNLEGEEGAVVAIVAAGEASRGDWGPRAAIGIARGWVDRGARVMLADLGLEHPSLHQAADLENGEGMSDVFLYGASIQRIARPLDGGAFFMASAGTVTSRPDELMDHSRWTALEEGFGSAAAVLILYVPEGDACLPGVLARAGTIVLLGDGASDPSTHLGEGQEKLLAALSPAGPVRDEQEGEDEEERAAEEVPDLTEGAPEEEPREEDGREAGETELPGEEPSVSVDSAETTSAFYEPRPPTSPARRWTSPWLLLLFILVLAGVAAAVWFGYLAIPGLDLPTRGGP